MPQVLNFGGHIAGGNITKNGPIVALHMLKHNDQRRLDPIGILKSLAFQIGKRFVSTLYYLCTLEVVGGESLEAGGWSRLEVLQGLYWFS